MRYIVTRFPKYTGIGKYVNDLEEVKGIDTTTYSLPFRNDANPEEYYGSLSKARYHLPGTSGWFLNTRFQGLVYKNLHKELLKDNLDPKNIFHYTDYGILPVTAKERSILTIHDLFQVSKNYSKYGYKPQPFLKKTIGKYLEFPHILADSKHVAKEAVEFGFENSPEVLYPPPAVYLKPGLDKQQCRKKYTLPTDKKLILSVSSNDPRKNSRGVSKTMDLLGDEYVLVRVGPPMDGAYNFRNLSGDTINEVYNACDVLLFPTLDEGFGYPLIEAMSTGLPFVSSSIEVVEEVSGNAGILVEPDPEKCAVAVKEALSNKDDLVN